MFISEKIKYRAKELGFSNVSFLKPTLLEKEARNLEKWLTRGFHGEMAYMEENFEKRVNPFLLMPEIKTIIIATISYHSENPNTDFKIANYAKGLDYHLVVKEKLNTLFQYILMLVGDVNGKAFVDSAPIMEKALAQRAGLGWMGKNGNMMNREDGSFFLLGSLFLDCELDYDNHDYKNYCGTCTACIDACPTQAIVEPQVINAQKCISYLTIELKREFTSDEKIHDWIFGCDVCQDVCPWNRFKKKTIIPEFESLHVDVKKETILLMKKSEFKKRFQTTALFRTGLRRLKRNVSAVISKKNIL